MVFRQFFSKIYNKAVVRLYLYFGAITTVWKSAFEEWIIYWQNHDGRSSLRPLTPVSLKGESIAKYEKELLAGLDTKKQPKTRNIAVTGAYAAGKSSFLHSFAERNRQFKYIKVSLARFDKIEIDTDDEQTDVDKKSIIDIEGSIVQQLLYTTSSEKLPDSRLQRIQHHSYWKVFGFTLGTILAAFSVAVIIQKKYGWSWSESSLIQTTRSFLPENIIFIIESFAPIVAELIIFGVVVYLLSIGVTFFRKLKVTDWTVKGGKLEIARSDSVLNKHLDEIIYFFERTSYNVVFIEDLDRFNQVHIFDALREINSHVNNSDLVKQPVYFIYAIKDSMFGSKDRVKFFDLIIPIVPYIDTANSGPKLYALLETIKIDDKKATESLSRDLIYKVADYIEDMRLITNIVNEFDVYLNRISIDVELDKNKLFSMVVIKNLFPQEHAELVKRSGVLFEIFKNFSFEKKRAIDSLNKDIRKNQDNIESRRQLIPENIKELRSIYWYKIFEDGKKFDSTRISVGQRGRVGIDVFLTDEFWEEAYSNNQHIILLDRNYNSILNTRMSLRNLTNSTNPTYHDKVGLLKENISQSLGRIRSIRETINKVERCSIREFFLYENPGFDFSFDLAQKNLGPIIYFLREGYFSEDYKDYLSYFYPGSISENDKRLSLGLGEGRKFDFSHKIDNPSALLKHITPSHLSGSRGLINELVKYLIDNKCSTFEEYSANSYLMELFSRSIDNFNQFREFIRQYDNENGNRRKLIEVIMAANHHLINKCMLDNDSYSLDKQAFFYDIMSVIEPSKHRLLSSEIVSVVSSFEDIRDIYKLSNENPKAWFWFKEKKVKFNNLGLEYCTKEMIRKVIDDRQYEINVHMISLLLSFSYSDEPEELAQVSYTALMSSDNEIFIGYINENLKDFVINTLIVQETVSEDEEYFIDLLNDDRLEDAHKLSLIRKTDLKLLDLKKVKSKGLYESLISTHQVVPSWRNVFTYFEQTDAGKLDDNLSLFLQDEDNFKALSDDDSLGEYESVDMFISEILECDDINTSVLDGLLSSMGFLGSWHLRREHLTQDRMGILVAWDRLPYSKQILEFINEAFPKLAPQYLIRRWDGFHRSSDEVELPGNIMLGLLVSNELTIREKSKLFPWLGVEIIEETKGLSSQILKLFGQPSGKDLALQIDFDVLNALFEDQGLELSKVRLLAFQLHHYCWSEIAILLSKLEVGGFNELSQQKRQFVVPMSEENFLLLESLKKKGVIGSLKIEKSYIRAHSKRSFFD
ncbi:YobI family P-loop NTPase [Endozoicomonas numazuensis]|uniref:YobI-like P-loop NTPase domain-containing protein n=1 Tax=Endozoicomonas numazuensis TaxID=1137799 RepID=A0A081NGP0_9GAMM|nr:hypothetical protein [Endozoicomonas numazuensis]KEQ17613.1 hypothetical protein GZ78_17960 [Endozoicomonas numazuensis]